MVVDLCVPGTDKLGLIVAVVSVAEVAGLVALAAWHPARAKPKMPTTPAITICSPIRASGPARPVHKG
jgi:hypothetical protein